MINIIFAIFIQLIVVWIAYCIHKGDILAPGFIIQVGVLLSLIGALIIFDIVNVKVTGNALGLIILGSISGLCGSVLHEMFFLKHRSIKIRNIMVCQNIHISMIKRNVLLILSILTVILLKNEIVRIAKIGQYVSGGEALIGTYREVIMSSYNFEQRINPWISQLTKLCGSAAFIAEYILTKNYLFKRYHDNYSFLKNNWQWFFVIVLNMIMFILQSARMGIIRLVISWIFFLLILSREQGMKLNIFTAINKSWKSILLLMIAFTAVRGFIGRKSKLPFVRYIAYYFGGSVLSFEIFLNNRLSHPKMWGTETFSGIYTLLSKVGIVENQSRALQFVKLSSILNDNVYTAFRRYFCDFGYFGVILLSIILVCVGQNVYLKIKKNQTGKNSVLLIMFGSFYYVFVMQGIDDLAYSSIISSTGFVNIVYIFLLCKCFLNLERY